MIALVFDALSGITDTFKADEWKIFKENIFGDIGLIGVINCALILTLMLLERRRANSRDAETGYNDLDAIYQRLLEQRIERPWLRDISLFEEGRDVTKREAMAAYRTHAYAVWTLLESIKDRLECERNQKLKIRTQRVWQPIIRSEGAFYLDELRHSQLSDQAFQFEFIAFIQRGGFVGIYGRNSADEAATRRFAAKAQKALAAGLTPGNLGRQEVATAA